MEAFLLYSLIFTLLYVFLSFIYFIAKANTSNPNVPPGSIGWPVLGENIDMAVSGPEKYISDRMRRYSSEVFKTSILGEKMAVFCGAAGNKFLFSNENSLLTTWWPQSLTKPLLGPTDAQNTVRKVALLNRSFIHEILKPENLKHYVPVMDSLAKEHIAQEWAPFGEVKELAKLREVKVYDLSKSYTFALACKLFLSIEGHDEVKRLSDPFILVTSGMFSLPLNLPGTAYNRAMKGGNMMRRQLLHVIKERKAEAMSSAGKAADEGRDLLARLLSATDEEGQHMNEEEICNNLVGLLIASYDTTSAAITFVLKYLAELPHIYDQVYKEQMEIAKSKGPNERLSWEDIQKMKYSWNVACEALRLFPPGQGAFREAVTDFTYAGFTIPKGWKTFWCVYSTHKNPKYFSEPEKFDPSRFEGSGPAPFTFVPFGGGPRMCPGKEYARLEVLVFMHNVVTNFKMEKLVPNEKIVYHASPVPVNGLPVRLIPHHN
ncbi:beta-amyrin 28-monooxygenase-like [Ipomoea triloba]|uniref:beta-amyrin 28-monooxygenase-like n=1 Tax=Ipomoea triloba TaxID=35885 RepID=UPI00125D7D3F|nr:beta-amyrin 28-monooxygenase-like [Ipomoea triloba]